MSRSLEAHREEVSPLHLRSPLRPIVGFPADLDPPLPPIPRSASVGAGASAGASGSIDFTASLSSTISSSVSLWGNGKFVPLVKACASASSGTDLQASFAALSGDVKIKLVALFGKDGVSNGEFQSACDGLDKEAKKSLQALLKVKGDVEIKVALGKVIVAGAGVKECGCDEA